MCRWTEKKSALPAGGGAYRKFEIKHSKFTGRKMLRVGIRFKQRQTKDRRPFFCLASLKLQTKSGIRARNVRSTSHLPPTEETLLSDLSTVGLLKDT